MTQPTGTSLCEASCAAYGRHGPQCPDESACRGCLPRQALPGRRLCAVHAERIAEYALEAPTLWAELAERLLGGHGNGERISGSSSGAPAPDEDVMTARDEIRLLLIRLTRLIVGGRGITPPARQVGRHTFVATDPVRLGRFVARHADWLAAHPRAGEHVDALRAAVRGRNRALAYAGGRERLYIGDCPLVVTGDDGQERVCGTRLHQAADQPLIECTGCGTRETIEQWQRWLVGELRGVTDAYALAAYLSMLWMRPVDASLIRQWACRGHVQAVTYLDPTPAEPQRESVARDHRGRTLYRTAEVLGYARAVWRDPHRPS